MNTSIRLFCLSEDSIFQTAYSKPSLNTQGFLFKKRLICMIQIKFHIKTVQLLSANSWYYYIYFWQYIDFWPTWYSLLFRRYSVTDSRNSPGVIGLRSSLSSCLLTASNRQFPLAGVIPSNSRLWKSQFFFKHSSTWSDFFWSTLSTLSKSSGL